MPPEMERIGRYDVIEVVGRGWVSTVYRAVDPVIGREVALKTLLLEKVGARSAEYRERFEREARAAGQLDHPGIVRVYDVGEEPERALLFLAMEYLDGGTLRDLLDSGVEFEPWHAAELGAGLAEALQVAHEAAIVHRDVKPANVLLALDGSVKLTDFGIARLGVSELTRSGATIGTPFYMAPEQITGRSVDGRADLYAVGVILYEMLAGRRPFRAEGIGELVHRISNEQAPPLDTLRPDLPPPLVAAVHRCLAKDPDERFASGRALAAALREACPKPAGAAEPPWASRSVVRRVAHPGASPAMTLPGDPVHTREVDGSLTTRIETPGRVPPPSRRRRRAFVFAAALVLVVLGGVVMRVASRQATTVPTPPDESRRLRQAVTTLQQAGDHLEAGDPEAARTAAMAVLAVDPGSPAAQRIVARAEAELDQLRLAALEERLAEPAAPPDAVRRQVKPARRTDLVIPTPTPRPPARPVMTVAFASPLSRGSLVAETDGERLDELTWDFSEPGLLGLRHGEGGQVNGEMELPAGHHHLRLELHAGRRGQIAAEEVEDDFPPGSRWRLVIHMETRRDTPTFTFERVRDGE